MRFDKWHNRGTLRSLIEGPFNHGEESILLKDIIGFNNWNWNLISFSFPKSLVLEIKATSFPLSATGGDLISWAPSASREFVLKEAYNLPKNEESDMCETPLDIDWV